jgi:predicted O-linked N-acetylglucosamine transferase (SPINDLY family)
MSKAHANSIFNPPQITFDTWLRILARVPQSILWLLRFPPAWEEHIIRQATLWGGDAIAQRIRFTDVARKEEYIARGRVADLFLDAFQVLFFSFSGKT